MPTLSIIIISFNTSALTLRCLETLYADLATTSISAEVIVVDNNSKDDSVSQIRTHFPQVTIIENPINAGFGAANNLAMQRATGEFFLLLNSDSFLKPGAIAALLATAQFDPKIAAAGPRTLCPDGSLQLSCFRFTTPGQCWRENLWLSQLFANSKTLGDYRRWPHNTPRTVDFVIGACMLVRAAAYQKVGGFDEAFFMYSEECDWQYRMHQAGMKIAFTPAAVVTHIGGASGIGEKAKINRAFFDSLDLYTKKHHGIPGLLSLRLAMTLGCSLRLVLWLVAFVISPRRRPTARAKIKLLSWLTLRQATHWHKTSQARPTETRASSSISTSPPLIRTP